MWVLKFKNWHKSCSIRPLCMKYNVTDFVYLLNYWKENNQVFYTELHILQGTEHNVNQFIKAMKKDPSIKKIERNGNQLTTLNQISGDKDIYAPVFDPQIIYVKPVTQRTDGFEDWELAAWNKETLMKVLQVEDFEIELKSIEEEKLTHLFIPHIEPRLAPKQHEALQLAVKEGYYKYPRNTYLENLATISKTTRATFQENLRRAESKLIPFLTEKIRTGKKENAQK